MKRIILMMAVLGFGLGLYAQDNDSPRAGGQYTQKVDFTDEATGLKFSIKSYDPCTVALMSSGDLIMTSRRDDLDNGGYLDWYTDYGYMDMPKNEYSGDIVIPAFVEHGPTSFNVSRISYGAFNQCVNLTSVTLPRDLFDVRRGAFYGCTSLTEVKRGIVVHPHAPVWPKDNTMFYPDAFRGCTSLRKVDLTMAGWCWDGIFAECPNLEEVSLFATGNKARAFKGRTVPSLKKLILYSYESDGLGTSDLELNFFFPEEYANTEVVVPKGQLAKYKAHFMWSGFRNIHEVGESSVDEIRAEPTWTLERHGDGAYTIAGDFENARLYSLQGIAVGEPTPGNPTFTLTFEGVFVLSVDGESLRLTR